MVARDKETGEIVGSVDLPGGAIGTPMTCLHDGRQFIALTVGGDMPELVAFALPGREVWRCATKRLEGGRYAADGENRIPIGYMTVSSPSSVRASHPRSSTNEAPYVTTEPAPPGTAMTMTASNTGSCRTKSDIAV